jgi:hypothetical protein
MATDDAISADEETDTHVVSLIAPVVVALTVGVGAVPVVNWTTYLGIRGARGYWVEGGDTAAAFQLGTSFAVALGLLLAFIGVISLVRIGRKRLFLLPGWGIAIAVVLVLGWVGIASFLGAIGGMGGPYPDPPAAQLFGRSLYYAYPTVVGLGVVGIFLAQVWLRHVVGRAARVIRILLPAVAAIIATVTIAALTYTAYVLHS